LRKKENKLLCRTLGPNREANKTLDKTAYRDASQSVLLIKHHSGDEMKQETDGAMTHRGVKREGRSLL
jgi:hypothetical protein